MLNTASPVLPDLASLLSASIDHMNLQPCLGSYDIQNWPFIIKRYSTRYMKSRIRQQPLNVWLLVYLSSEAFVKYKQDSYLCSDLYGASRRYCHDEESQNTRSCPNTPSIKLRTKVGETLKLLPYLFSANKVSVS